jgi:hypothetical protein
LCFLLVLPIFLLFHPRCTTREQEPHLWAKNKVKSKGLPQVRLVYMFSQSITGLMKWKHTSLKKKYVKTFQGHNISWKLYFFFFLHREWLGRKYIVTTQALTWLELVLDSLIVLSCSLSLSFLSSSFSSSLNFLHGLVFASVEWGFVTKFLQVSSSSSSIKLSYPLIIF